MPTPACDRNALDLNAFRIIAFCDGYFDSRPLLRVVRADGIFRAIVPFPVTREP